MGFVGDARGKQMLGTLITPTRMRSLSPVHSFRVSRRLTELNSSQLGFSRALLECNPRSEALGEGSKQGGWWRRNPTCSLVNQLHNSVGSVIICCLFVLFVCFFRSVKTKTETRGFNNQESINQLKGRDGTTMGRLATGFFYLLRNSLYTEISPGCKNYRQHTTRAQWPT